MRINLIDLLKKINIPLFFNYEIFFDLGTTTTKIAIRDKGVILKEPSILAYNTKIKEYIFFGHEAKTIIGKTPFFIKVIKPMINGVISDFDAEVALLKMFMNRSVNLYFNHQLIKPLLTGLAVVPPQSTEIEQKAVEESLRKVGLSQVFLIEKPMATIVGCGKNIFSHHSYMVVDMGGGLIEISIVGSGGIIAHKTLKTAGDSMNKVIYNYIYLKYGIILGESTCEELKIILLNFIDEEKIKTIRGKSLENGLPKSIKIKSSEIKEALLNSFNLIIDAIKEQIESSPPEIVDEVIKNGIILTGGLAKIRGIDTFIGQELKVDVMIHDSPDLTTINGLLRLSNHKDQLAKLVIR